MLRTLYRAPALVAAAVSVIAACDTKEPVGYEVPRSRASFVPVNGAYFTTVSGDTVRIRWWFGAVTTETWPAGISIPLSSCAAEGDTLHTPPVTYPTELDISDVPPEFQPLADALAPMVGESATESGYPYVAPRKTGVDVMTIWGRYKVPITAYRDRRVNGVWENGHGHIAPELEFRYFHAWRVFLPSCPPHDQGGGH